MLKGSKKGLSYSGKKLKNLFLKIKYPLYFAIGGGAATYVIKKAPVAKLFTVDEIDEFISLNNYEYGTLLKKLSELYKLTLDKRDQSIPREEIMNDPELLKDIKQLFASYFCQTDDPTIDELAGCFEVLSDELDNANSYLSESVELFEKNLMSLLQKEVVIVVDTFKNVKSFLKRY